MRNALIVIALYFVVLVEYALARIYGGFGPWFLFGASLCLVFYETIAYRSLRRRYTLVRHMSITRVSTGGHVDVTLQVKIARSGLMPLFWLRVEDQLPQKLAVRLEQPYLLTHPWRDSEVTVRYELKNVPRGAYRIAGAHVTSGDLFGLLTRRVWMPGEGQLIAYPEIRHIPRWSAAERARLGNRVNQSRASDDAARVIGVRDYVQGDRLSRIHWPATARTGALRSKEFEHYVMNEVVLVLDATRVSYGHDMASFELALSLAGSFVRHLHEAGIAYGMQSFAKPYSSLPVGKGDQTLVRAMEYLAVVECEGEEAMADVLWRLAVLPSQTTALVITSHVNQDWLRFGILAREKQLRVELFLTRVSDKECSREEEDVIGRLRVLGWRIRVLHAIEQIEQLETGWGAYASRA